MNVVIPKKSKEKFAPIPSIIPLHCLLNESVHNTKIFNFDVML